MPSDTNHRHVHPTSSEAGTSHAHGHATARWSALASDAGGRLARVAIVLAVLWLAVGWALAGEPG